MSDPVAELKAELIAAARRRQADAAASPSIPHARSRRRWRHLAALAAALILGGGTAAAAVKLSGERSAPLSGTLSHLHRGGGAHSPSSAHYRITMLPELQAGHTGWCKAIAIGASAHPGGGGGCGPAPLASKQLIAGGSSVVSNDQMLEYALVGPRVASVLFDERRVRTIHAAGLPRGWRAAVTLLRFHTPHAGPHGEPPAAPSLRWTALNSAGRPFPKPRRGEHAIATPTRAVSTAHPPAGRCSIHQVHRLPGLKPISARTITGRPRPQTALNGEAFTSCAQTRFTLDGSTLAAAVLINASHPGRPPAPLPGASPQRGAPGLLEIETGLRALPPLHLPGLPSPSPLGPIAARRAGKAWLAVQGASRRQRDALLAALATGG